MRCAYTVETLRVDRHCIGQHQFLQAMIVWLYVNNYHVAMPMAVCEQPAKQTAHYGDNIGFELEESHTLSSAALWSVTTHYVTVALTPPPRYRTEAQADPAAHLRTVPCEVSCAADTAGR